MLLAERIFAFDIRAIIVEDFLISVHRYEGVGGGSERKALMASGMP